VSALCALIFQSSPTADAAGRGWVVVVAVIIIKANTHTRFSSSFFWFFAEPMQQLVAIVIIDANHLSRAGGCVWFVGGRCSNLMITMLLTSSRILVVLLSFLFLSISIYLSIQILTTTTSASDVFLLFSLVFLLFLLPELSVDLCKFPHRRVFFLRLNRLFSLFLSVLWLLLLLLLG
jgi:hypothetical protein